MKEPKISIFFENIEKNCLNCGKPFIIKDKRTEFKKYCSIDCGVAYRKTHKVEGFGFGNCIVCGERFKRITFAHKRCLKCRIPLKRYKYKKQFFPRFCERCRFQVSLYSNSEFCDKCNALKKALKKESNRYAMEKGSCLVFFGYFWIVQPYELAMKNKAKGKDVCCNLNEFEQFKELRLGYTMPKKTEIVGLYPFPTHSVLGEINHE